MFDIFISYRREDNHLAGRIYDRLVAAGFNPFFDIEKMAHKKWREEIKTAIEVAPNFLLVASEHFWRNQEATEDEDWYFKEIEYACKQKKSCENKKLFIVPTGSFDEKEKPIPESMQEIFKKHYRKITPENFHTIMNGIVEKCVRIEEQELFSNMSWVREQKSRANVYMTNRENLEKNFARWESCFGKQFVKSANEEAAKDYTMPGDKKSHNIKMIRMSCYASSLLLAPRDNVDSMARDMGLMSKIFKQLLRDTEFTLHLILTKTGSLGMQDAINYDKLGNDAMSDKKQEIFTDAWDGIRNLIENDEVYSYAYKKNRLQVYFTEMCMPFALFQIQYKQEFEKLNQIKVDLYASCQGSNMERRSMIILENKIDNRSDENYKFFESQISMLTEGDKKCSF